jgi:NAD(P)-dependent dehydrogenase (short-subunit alcohol dehydrogenase family)
MVMNEVIGRYVAENPGAAAMVANLMPIDLIQARDISNAIAFLVSDEGRYITGVTLPVDAGFLVK